MRHARSILCPREKHFPRFFYPVSIARFHPRFGVSFRFVDHYARPPASRRANALRKLGGADARACVRPARSTETTIPVHGKLRRFHVFAKINLARRPASVTIRRRNDCGSTSVNARISPRRERCSRFIVRPLLVTAWKLKKKNRRKKNQERTKKKKNPKLRETRSNRYSRILPISGIADNSTARCVRSRLFRNVFDAIRAKLSI